jgi:hypothetical protein
MTGLCGVLIKTKQLSVLQNFIFGYICLNDFQNYALFSVSIHFCGYGCVL